jgi:hypothetical protein
LIKQVNDTADEVVRLYEDLMDAARERVPETVRKDNGTGGQT